MSSAGRWFDANRVSNLSPAVFLETTDPLRKLPPELFGKILFFGGFGYAERCRLKAVCRSWRDYIETDPHSYDLFVIGYNNRMPLSNVTKLVRRSLGTLRVVAPKERKMTDAMWPNFRERMVSQLFISLDRIKDIYFYTRMLYDHNVTPITSENFIPQLSWRFLYRVPPKAAKSNDLRVLYHAGIDEGFFKTFMQNVTDMSAWYQDADLSFNMNSWLQWDGWKVSLTLSILTWVQYFSLRVDSMLAFLDSVASSAQSYKRLTNLKFYANWEDKAVIEDTWNRKLQFPDDTVLFPNLRDFRVNEEMACDYPVNEDCNFPQHRMGLHQLKALIRHMPSLHTLVVSHTTVHSEARESALDLGQHSISRLDLSGSDLDRLPVLPVLIEELLLPSTLVIPSDDLTSLFETSKLSHLDLRENRYIDQEELIQILSALNPSSLKTLQISGCPVVFDNFLIDKMDNLLPQLRVLDISKNSSVDDELLQYMFMIKYGERKFGRLRDLDISHTAVTASGLKAVLEMDDPMECAYEDPLETTIHILDEYLDLPQEALQNQHLNGVRHSIEILKQPLEVRLHSTRTYNFDRKSAGFNENGRCPTCPCCADIW